MEYSFTDIALLLSVLFLGLGAGFIICYKVRHGVSGLLSMFFWFLAGLLLGWFITVVSEIGGTILGLLGSLIGILVLIVLIVILSIILVILFLLYRLAKFTVKGYSLI